MKKPLGRPRTILYRLSGCLPSKFPNYRRGRYHPPAVKFRLMFRKPADTGKMILSYPIRKRIHGLHCNLQPVNYSTNPHQNKPQRSTKFDAGYKKFQCILPKEKAHIRRCTPVFCWEICLNYSFRQPDSHRISAAEGRGICLIPSFKCAEPARGGVPTSAQRKVVGSA